jgi:hypothetical protein
LSTPHDDALAGDGGNERLTLQHISKSLRRRVIVVGKFIQRGSKFPGRRAQLAGKFLIHCPYQPDPRQPMMLFIMR